MRIKLDECVPVVVAERLAQQGHDVHIVHQEGLAGAPDQTIWLAAQRESRFLITTDLDFSDIRQYRPGTHAGVLLIRLKHEGQANISQLVDWLFASHAAQSWTGCFVVASDHKVRVRRP